MQQDAGNVQLAQPVLEVKILGLAQVGTIQLLDWDHALNVVLGTRVQEELEQFAQEAGCMAKLHVWHVLKTTIVQKVCPQYHVHRVM